MKVYHDRKLIKNNFQAGQEVLLFNSMLSFFPDKLKCKWSGPFTIKEVKPYGAVELVDVTSSEPKRSWNVNGQRLKIYNGDYIENLQWS